MNLRARAVLLLGVLTVSACLFLQTAKAAQCVKPREDGALVLAPSPLAECTGFVLMDKAEFDATPTLASLFAMPETIDLQKTFAKAFGLPVLLWFVAYGIGTVVQFIRRG